MYKNIVSQKILFNNQPLIKYEYWVDMHDPLNVSYGLS